MPRQGRRRKKTRTEKEEGIAEKELKLTPRCFVVKRGQIGDRIKDLVKDFRQVMMPNCAKNLRERKLNRIEDFTAVASHFHVSHVVIFSATKAATYMKLARLPQGPTLTFKVDSFTLAREVRAAQKRPRGSTRDYTNAPLQVLNGFGGPTDAPEGAGGGKAMKGPERQLVAEMLRGFFPAIDVPSFHQADCRRAALFHYERESDSVIFRHFVVGRRQVGLERGIARLMKINRLPSMGRKSDISDYVLGGGGGASESEIEEGAEIPTTGAGKVAVRLSEAGPRMKLVLVKAEEGVCTGGVIYHRYMMKTPSQQAVLQERARQRQKLRERNQRLEQKAKASQDKQKKRRREQNRNNDDGSDEEARVPNPGESDSDADPVADKGRKQSKRFHPFAFKAKGKKREDGGLDAKAGSGKAKGKGGQAKAPRGFGQQGKARNKILDKFKSSAKR
eukprot:TRINITY_DN27260_c0_g1_i1.p1 TRINITY_DN27260_c0_g1~~TRINITY_DN27260_c0_g1_i1.p1  ORF type:complete len:447 (-),score=95.13 TRINITY_DN27260_c0_g1_i1:41-1381(-)